MFSCGMVMRHRRYNYDCVISGWDARCQAERAWITYMGVDQLRLQDKQPFYHVLADDGSNRYAAQENLAPLEAAEAHDVDHPEVGRHFSKREGTHYVLNSEAAARYPEDEDYRRQKYPNPAAS